jgi:hypothetical protein
VDRELREGRWERKIIHQDRRATEIAAICIPSPHFPYTDAAGVQHGFVRKPYGTITTFDPPQGKQTTATSATSINDGGAIAGFYQYNAGGGPPVGFIRLP